MFDFSAVPKGPRKSVPPLKEQKVRAGERSGLDFDRRLRFVSTLCADLPVSHISCTQIIDSIWWSCSMISVI